MNHENLRGTSGCGDGVPSVLQKGDELLGIASGRKTGLAGADYSEGFSGGKMRESFFQAASKVELRSLWSDAEDGLAEAVDAMGGGFKGLGDGIVRISRDDDLQWMMGEKRGGQAVSGREEAVLGGNAGEGFERFLGQDIVAVVAGEGVHSNQGDGSDGIGAGRWGILERLAADVKAAHGGGVGGSIEEPAAFGVTVAGDGEVHGFLRGAEIAGIEGGFVGVEKRDNAEHLIVERAFQGGAADAVAEAAGFAPDFFQHAV